MVPDVELITVKALEADLGKTVISKALLLVLNHMNNSKSKLHSFDNGVDAMYVYRASTTTPFEAGMEVTVKVFAPSMAEVPTAQGAEVEVLGSVRVF